MNMSQMSSQCPYIKLNLSRFIHRFVTRFDWTTIDLVYLKKWTVLGIIIGVFSGLLVIAAFESIRIFSSFFLSDMIRYIQPYPEDVANLSSDYSLYVLKPWLIPVILGFTGLVIGIISTKLSPAIGKNGIDEISDEFHNKKSQFSLKISFLRSFSSILAIGSGTSGGVEDSLGHTGSTFGAIIGRIFKLDQEEIRIAIAAGMGSTIGGVLRLPFGGSIFSLELLYRRDFIIKSLYPALLASITSYIISGIVLDWPSFLYVPHEFIIKTSFQSLAAYAAMAAIIGIIGIGYVKTVQIFRKHFENMKIPLYFRSALGGIIIGIFAIGFPEILGTGYGWLQLATVGNHQLFPLWIMFPVIVMKIFATAVSNGSRNSTGLLGPSLVIGGLIGSALITLFHSLGIFMFIDTTSATLISIFAFFTASTRTPISAIVIGIEIVGSYTLLIPIVISVIISNIISGQNNCIYKNYVSNMKLQLLNAKKNNSELRNYLVRDAMNSDFYNINRNTTINDAINIMKDLNVKSLIVTNNEDKLQGMVYFEALSNVSTIQKNTIVETIMVFDPPVLRPLDPILNYFELISKTAVSEVPVVSPDDDKLVLSILSIRDIDKLLNNINDPILPDLEDSKLQKHITNNLSHDFSINQDIHKNNKILNKLRNYWTQ
ncbi:MAG: chloride channel protein [Thaumarchaeota archaeon]|nr:MAG: chloride channel protein [Nitrososphaerota archaeon]TLX89474.1 MAG: chloride channel protein [Nitrososphaerota archaeon]